MKIFSDLVFLMSVRKKCILKDFAFDENDLSLEDAIKGWFSSEERSKYELR